MLLLGPVCIRLFGGTFTCTLSSGHQAPLTHCLRCFCPAALQRHDRQGGLHPPSREMCAATKLLHGGRLPGTPFMHFTWWPVVTSHTQCTPASQKSSCHPVRALSFPVPALLLPWHVLPGVSLLPSLTDVQILLSILQGKVYVLHLT